MKQTRLSTSHSPTRIPTLLRLQRDGALFQPPIGIADEATVQALAAEYNLEYDEAQGGYLFPVNWAEYGTDTGYSKDGQGNVVEVAVDRFAYTDAKRQQDRLQPECNSGKWLHLRKGC